MTKFSSLSIRYINLNSTVEFSYAFNEYKLGIIGIIYTELGEFLFKRK